MVFIVIVDGIISSGKSTILKELKNKGFKIEQQRVEDWKHLTSFYENPLKYAYQLQLEVLSSYNDIYSMYKDNYGNDIIFCESYAFACLNSFQKLLLEKGNLTSNQILDLKKSIIAFKPSLYIWLNVDVDTCMKRIKIRSRPGEENIKREYLEDLKEKYEEFMKNCDFPVISVNNNREHTYALDEILNFIESKSKKYLLTIQGNIGSGKTTLCNYLNSLYPKVEEVLDKDLLDSLEKKYKGKGSAYEVEKKFIAMHKEEMEKLKNTYNNWEGVLSLIDIFSFIEYVNGNISTEEFDDLKSLFKISKLPTVNDFKLIVWLRPSVEILLKRIKDRARPGEENINRKHLDKIDELYYLMFSNVKHVLIFDNEHMSKEIISKVIHEKLRELYFR